MNRQMADSEKGADIRVRVAAPADRESARAVSHAAFQSLRAVYRPTGDAVKRQAARTEEGVRWIAERAGVIVGTAQAAEHRDHIHIMGLAVHPDHQRQGIARRLVERLADEASGLGFSVIALDTIRETGNIPLFERLGFSTVSESKAVWCASETDNTLHDVRMERKVGEGR